MYPSDHDRNDLANGIPDGGTKYAIGPEDDRWLRSVVDNSSEIIKVVDLDGTLRYASPALERVLGYDPDEVIGTNVLDYVHPDDLSRVLGETEKVMRRAAWRGTWPSTASGTPTAPGGAWRAWAPTCSTIRT